MRRALLGEAIDLLTALHRRDAAGAARQLLAELDTVDGAAYGTSVERIAELARAGAPSAAHAAE